MQKVKGGVQSVDVGMRLLKTLAAIGGRATLNELSEATQLHSAKVHRYMVSLVDSGFVERTAHGRYDLGPYVLEFATSYLSRLDPTTIANSMIEQLRSETNEGIILSVWGEAGTTVIRWLQSGRPISVGIRPGAIFSGLMSASGRIFLAYLHKAVTRQIIKEEFEMLRRDANPLAPQSMEEVDAILEETRERGMARVTGHSIEYVSSLAAPIFDYRSEVVLALALFGFKTDFDVSWDGHNAQVLERAAGEISKKLGYVPESLVY